MMTELSSPATRAGYSNITQGTESTHTLIIILENRSGSTERVMNIFRRRRAKLLSFALAEGKDANTVRITARVQDAEVAVDNLVEQIRKIVDVQQAIDLPTQQAFTRELVLIKVSSAHGIDDIVAQAKPFGATVVEVADDAATLEAVGSPEDLDQFIAALQPFGILELARSGCVALPRGTSDTP
jgi:acetolactate synthase I/III small subunit